MDASEAGDRSTPSQTCRFRQISRRTGDQTGGLVESCTRFPLYALKPSVIYGLLSGEKVLRGSRHSIEKNKGKYESHPATRQVPSRHRHTMRSLVSAAI